MSRIRLSSRVDALIASQIREMMRLAQDVGAINMAQGAPDFPAADELKEAACRAIHDNRNQYTVPWGLAELREAVSRMLADRYGLATDPSSDLTITCGVTEAIVAVLLATLEPGDEVVVIEPAHENYVPAIAFAGGVPTFVPLRAPAFRLDGDELAAVVTPKTRAIVLNTPHNPSGRVFAREELQAIADVAQRHDLLVITDEIYDRLTYDGREHLCLATFDGMSERTVTTGGISKIFTVTGWRLAYVAAPAALSAGIRKVHDYLTICAPTPFQHAALTALAMPASYFESVQADFTDRRTRMMAAFEAGGLTAAAPEGAYYVLADYRAWGRFESADAFCKHLIIDAGVATVPGPAFYYGHPELGRHLVRFAFAKQPDTLDEVHRRLAAGYARARGGA